MVKEMSENVADREAEVNEIMEEIIRVQKKVTQLAEAIQDLQSGLSRRGEEMESVSKGLYDIKKAMHGKGFKNMVVKRILSGDIDTQSAMFRKDRSMVKQLTKSLERVMYV